MTRKQSEDEKAYRKADKQMQNAHRWAFPKYCCPMSRAAIIGAERLASHRDNADFHLAKNILLTVIALWELRRKTGTHL